MTTARSERSRNLIIIPGKPVPKGRPRMTKTGHVYTPEPTSTHEDWTRWAIKASGHTAEPDPHKTYRLTAVYYLAKGQRADVDNLLKLSMDALQGLVYTNDKQVTEVAASVRRNGEPRTELLIEVIA